MVGSVQDVMTRAVVIAHEGDPITELIRLMRQYRVSSLPVVGSRRTIVGVVSEVDLLLQSGFGPFSSHRVGESDGLADVSDGPVPVACDLMTAPAITIHPGVSIEDAANVMGQNHVKRLPVIDAEGSILGIVSRVDLLGAFLRGEDEIAAAVMSVLTSELFLPESSN